MRPAYENFCFSSLPGLFEQVLLGASSRPVFPQEVISAVGAFDHVVFLFFDAFGWESFQRFRQSESLLQTIDRGGLVLKTTSQYPSTTAVHVTTEITGMPVYQHEVCGWDYFEPRVGRMIKPLRMSYSEDKAPGTLLEAGFRPEQVLPSSDFMRQFIASGVSVRRYGPASYFPSPYGTPYTSNEHIHGYKVFPEAVDGIINYLRARPSKSYQYLYVDLYDTVCHEHGVGSNQADAVAREIVRQTGELLTGEGLPRTLLVISADHGHMSNRPDGGIAINVVMPDLVDMLKPGADGSPIRYSGGRRYLFLHPRPEAHEFLLAELRGRLAGAATVMSLKEAEIAGLLGPQPVSASFAERLGSIAVLPHAGFSVYWEEPPAFEFGQLSSHGGLSPQEMETPLLLLPL